MGFESPFAIEEVQDLPKNVPMRFNLDTKKIEVSPEAKYSKPIVLQHLVEEILHGIDSVRSRSTISASSKKFNRQTGIVTREALDHYEGGGELSAFLKYPFHHKYKLSDTQTQAELFARLGVVYLGNPGLLKETLPNAYQVYHEIFGLEIETPADSDRYVFRKVWQGGSARNRKMGSEPGVSRSAEGEASGTDRQGGAGRGLDGIRAAVARASEGSRLGRLVEFWSLDTRYTPEQEAALKKAREFQNLEKEQEILKESGNKIRYRKFYNKVQRRLSKIRKQMGRLKLSKKLSPDQKKEEMDKLQQQLNRTAKLAVQRSSKDF